VNVIFVYVMSLYRRLLTLRHADEESVHLDETNALKSVTEAPSPRQEEGRVPTDPRAHMAAKSSEHYELMAESLFECLDAMKDVYHTCSKCGKRDPIKIPDANARVKAVETLLNQGFGRPQEHRTHFLKDRDAIREAFKAYCQDIPEKPMEDYTDEELMALVVAGEGDEAG
jgi:hypothetical protein